MKRMVIIGTGDLARQVISIAEKQKKYTILGFYDDYFQDSTVYGLPVFGNLDRFERDFHEGVFDFAFFAIGYSRLAYKQSLLERYPDIPLATIIDPTAIIEPDAILEGGVLVYPLVYIGNRVRVEACAVVNISTILPHDVNVGICSFLSAGINVGGKVDIGNRCFIGIGTTINDSLTIVDEVIIGSGTLIIKSITELGTYVGAPARKIKNTI